MAWQAKGAGGMVGMYSRTAVALLFCVAVCAAISAAPTAQAQTYTVIGNFGTNGTGVDPLYVTLDGAGNVYGTTYYGGLSYLGYGVVFKLTRHGSNWIQSVLYDFTGGSDGGHPYGGVVFGPDGSLYGTASSGGRVGQGVVFKLQPPATECRRRKWRLWPSPIRRIRRTARQSSMPADAPPAMRCQISPTVPGWAAGLPYPRRSARFMRRISRPIPMTASATGARPISSGR